MENAKIKNESITRRDDDFAKWYTDVCRKAELMDYSSVKGFIIYRPYGYAIWEQIQTYLDRQFKKTGHQNVYMPLVIPESLFNKEKEHVAGFAPETLIATQGGQEKLEERLIVRPTSEVLFCEHYAKVVSSYRDLPKKYNQWCSVVRWEKTTRPFLRGSEFLWQEGHTIHASELEARQETLQILEVYRRLGEELLAIPFLTGRKSEKEKFAGAKETYGIEALMHDGKSLQSGTTHYFGTGFAEAFGIKFQDRDNVLKPVHQTSWGVSTRLIGSIIMVHGDDNGLVLPPHVAPIQIVIVPIQMAKPGVLESARELTRQLEGAGYRVHLDESEQTPGWKFAEYEMKGVPLRLEIGPRDIDNQVVVAALRHDHSKQTIARADVVMTAGKLLQDTHEAMLAKAQAHLHSHIVPVANLDDLLKAVETGYAKAMWCGCQECEDKVKQLSAATSRVMPFDQAPCGDRCAVCGRPAKHVIYFAKAY